MSNAETNLRLRASDPIYAANRIMQLKTMARRALFLLREEQLLEAAEILEKILEGSYREPIKKTLISEGFLDDENSWKQAGPDIKAVFKAKIKNKFRGGVGAIIAWNWFRLGWAERAVSDFRKQQ